APLSMIETVINYKSEYISDKNGERITFKFDKNKNEFLRDSFGNLIQDIEGRPYRQWRDHIKNANDIWREIIKAARIPGSTSAPKLQPIAARLVMLQSGMRSLLGIKIKGTDLKSIESAGIEIERLLKNAPGVEASSVIADRIIGKPYLEIDIDRVAISRYGLNIDDVQRVIEVAVGGEMITTTVENRERYPVRVRYKRELRDSIEALEKILVTTMSGTHIPLMQLAEIKFTQGPQEIKAEDTFLMGYVLFDKKNDIAEVEVVEKAKKFLDEKIEAGELKLPAGITYSFAGNYVNQIRAEKKLFMVIPIALFLIFLILYFQFKSTLLTCIVFSGIFVAWSGGFIMIWLYNQPWFMDFSLFGENMRNIFQIHNFNLSVAVWVGFLALFGIASDDGVVMMTYICQVFEKKSISDKKEIHNAIIAAGERRIRPCLMTTATTLLALLPVLTSSGRGSDIMIPMAIPSFGGMLIEVITMFIVPVLYSLVVEIKSKWS
nr:efflux RND transporter permease subunit [Candidatus Dependentiae bacterium]